MSSLLKYISVLLAGKSNENIPFGRRTKRKDTDTDTHSSFYLSPCLGVAAGKQRLRPLVSRQLRGLRVQKRGTVRFARSAQRLPVRHLPNTGGMARLVGIRAGAVVELQGLAEDGEQKSMVGVCSISIRYLWRFRCRF